MRNPLQSDTGVYVASGLFAVLVFVVAVAVLVFFTPAEPSMGELLTFTVGFLLFVGVYFAAMVIHRGIDG